MAKALSEGKGKSEQKQEQKKRKKQAKKEAKLMLLVEKAKKGVHKAEQKAAKAQTNLQTSKTQLQKLEETLSQLHHTNQGTSEVLDGAEHAEQPHTEEETHQTAASKPDELNTAGEELQTASDLPAEGRDDISAETSANTSAATHPAPDEEEFVISSGGGSIPIVTHDEHAWPPSQIREEIAQSVEEEVAQEHATSTNEDDQASSSEAIQEQEHAISTNEDDQASEVDEPEFEEDAEHQEGTNQPRRSTRRKSSQQV